MATHDQTVFVEVFESGRHVLSTSFVDEIEIGRQQQTEPKPYRLVEPEDDGNFARLLVAPLENRAIPRKFVQVTTKDRQQFTVTNLSTSGRLTVDGKQLAAEQKLTRKLPVMLRIGDVTVRLAAAKEDYTVQRSARPVLTPTGDSAFRNVTATIGSTFSSNLNSDDLIEWLQAILPILHEAAISPDFVKQASAAVRQIVELDAAAVLLRKNGEWEVQSRDFAPDSRLSEWQPSRYILQLLLEDEERRTLTGVPNTGEVTESIRVVQSVVAAPILNAEREVIGAIYGDRRKEASSGPFRAGITEPEALMVQLLAGAVALGVSRMEQERVADEARTLAIQSKIQFEQFFTRELAEQLARDPEMILEGRNAEVSILFADIRGFSSISKRIGPKGTVRWICDVMSELSECVVEFDGVLVDYIGDELMAMWGAPTVQPDHALKACRAATSMLNKLPEISSKWEAELGEAFGLGIGINSGPAYVGNTGSRRKLKFGPLGNSVNVASRVQGVTKHYGVPLLVTDNTIQELRGVDSRGLDSRRLANVRVVGISEPFGLYELVQDPADSWQKLRQHYEQALARFEAGEFRQACRLLAQILTEHEDDSPTLQLLSHCVQALTEPSDEFEAVVTFAQK